MTKKKKKVTPCGKYQSLSFNVKETVLKQQTKHMPTNLEEEKAKFFKSGNNPKFKIQDPSVLKELAGKAKNQIRFDLLGEAEFILEKVRDQYGNGELYMEQAFGVRISREEATPLLLSYISENSLSESINIHWCDNIACSAKMIWTGPVQIANRPELRKYSLWINSSDENSYMRESGIQCLMDHEIGTHFFRMVNDGFQPWFADRSKFGMRSASSFEALCTEEGLATIHTVLRGKQKLLWTAALSYFTACKAAEMTFKQLFDHLGRYTSNLDARWKMVMRVKRGLADPNDLGGFGNDQCYFEGAVKILRSMDDIDFQLLMTGKVCVDELDRIKRCARRDVVRYPVFLKNMTAYRRSLKKMAEVNGLNVIRPRQGPPSAYLRRLAERRSESKKGRKVRHKQEKFLPRRNKKEDSTIESVEVRSFSLTNPVVDVHLRMICDENKKKEESRVMKLVDSLSNQLKSFDSQMDKHLNQLQTIVKEHSWSNDGSEYKQDLLLEASGDSEVMSSELCCLDKEGPEGDRAGTKTARSRSSLEGGENNRRLDQSQCHSSLRKDMDTASTSEIASTMSVKSSNTTLSHLKRFANNKRHTPKAKKRVVMQPSVARLTSTENLDLNEGFFKQKSKNLEASMKNIKPTPPLTPKPKTSFERPQLPKPDLTSIETPSYIQRGADTPTNLRAMGNMAEKENDLQEITEGGQTLPSIVDMKPSTGTGNSDAGNVPYSARSRRKPPSQPLIGDCQVGVIQAWEECSTPPDARSHRVPSGSVHFNFEKANFMELPHRVSLHEQVSNPSSVPKYSTSNSTNSYMTSSILQPLIVKSVSALKKNETASVESLPLVSPSK